VSSGNESTVKKKHPNQQAKREAHICDKQAKRWQQLAALPHGDFEGRLHAPLVKPTTSGIEKREGGRTKFKLQCRRRGNKNEAGRFLLREQKSPRSRRYSFRNETLETRQEQEKYEYDRL
jgi:hypothetical protein